MQNSKNIFWHKQKVKREDREKLNGHKAVCIWLTGLSGSGKSTLANELSVLFHTNNLHCYVLDGDNVRHGLNKNLGFSPADRTENIRRVGELARLFVDAGIIVITAFISPYKKDRDAVRQLLNKSDFIEIYLDCDLDTCERRDPKSLYKKARENKVDNFTGITDAYEKPDNPELVINTSDDNSPKENAAAIFNYLKTQGYLE